MVATEAEGWFTAFLVATISTAAFISNPSSANTGSVLGAGILTIIAAVPCLP